MVSIHPLRVLVLIVISSATELLEGIVNRGEGDKVNDSFHTYDSNHVEASVNEF